MALELTAAERSTLVSVARLTLQTVVKTGCVPDLDLRSPGLCQRLGAFVYLTALGRFRGSAGELHSSEPLYCTVMHLTRVACEDEAHGFIEAEELHQTRIEIDVVTDIQPAVDIGEIVPGRHGLAFSHSAKAAIPRELAIERGWDAREMVAALCEASRVRPDDWQRYGILRFTTVRLSEEDAAHQAPG